MSPEGISDMVLEDLNFLPFEHVRDKQGSARFTRISCWGKKKKNLELLLHYKFMQQSQEI